MCTAKAVRYSVARTGDIGTHLYSTAGSRLPRSRRRRPGAARARPGPGPGGGARGGARAATGQRAASAT